MISGSCFLRLDEGLAENAQVFLLGCHATLRGAALQSAHEIRIHGMKDEFSHASGWVQASPTASEEQGAPCQPSCALTCHQTLPIVPCGKGYPCQYPFLNAFCEMSTLAEIECAVKLLPEPEKRSLLEWLQAVLESGETTPSEDQREAWLQRLAQRRERGITPKSGSPLQQILDDLR